MDQSQEECELSSIVRDPQRYALRAGVRTVGRQLFRLLNSTDALGDVLERVADLDPASYGRRASLMDHAWNGIGSDTDRWWS